MAEVSAADLPLDELKAATIAKVQDMVTDQAGLSPR